MLAQANFCYVVINIGQVRNVFPNCFVNLACSGSSLQNGHILNFMIKNMLALERAHTHTHTHTHTYKPSYFIKCIAILNLICFNSAIEIFCKALKSPFKWLSANYKVKEKAFVKHWCSLHKMQYIIYKPNAYIQQLWPRFKFKSYTFKVFDKKSVTKVKVPMTNSCKKRKEPHVNLKTSLPTFPKVIIKFNNHLTNT
jgi:hypothetical protein